MTMTSETQGFPEKTVLDWGPHPLGPGLGTEENLEKPRALLLGKLSQKNCVLP